MAVLKVLISAASMAAWMDYFEAVNLGWSLVALKDTIAAAAMVVF